jgi:hypothetical protein
VGETLLPKRSLGTGDGTSSAPGFSLAVVFIDLRWSCESAIVSHVLGSVLGKNLWYGDGDRGSILPTDPIQTLWESQSTPITMPMVLVEALRLGELCCDVLICFTSDETSNRVRVGADIT